MISCTLIRGLISDALSFGSCWTHRSRFPPCRKYLKRSLWTSGMSRRGLHPGTTSGPDFHSVPTVTKDLLLYKNNNTRFFRVLTTFGASQFVFWNYLAWFVQATGKDINPAEEVKESSGKARPFIYKIKRALEFDNKYTMGISFLLSALGCGCLLIPGLMTLRSVHMVVLRKGGQKVDLVTFALFGTRRTLGDLPLDHISCQHSMHTSKSNMALKVKGRSFYFLVDLSGHFPKPKLFEQTVGLHRTFKK